MNEQEMLQLLEAAQKRLAEGMPMHQVNDNIRRLSGGAFNGFMSLQLAIPEDVRRGSRDATVRNEANEQRQDEQLRRFNTAGPVQHFAESAFQGATLGFGDEIMSALGNEGYGERLDARRELNPGASLAGEFAGMLVPGAGVSRVMQAAQKGAGFLGSAVRGAGVAAAESGIAGAGEAEGGLAERAGGAAVGAAFGAPFGALGPVLGRVARPFRSNRALAGIEGRDILEQTGQKAEDVFEEMRRLKRNPGLGGAVAMADVDPSIGARAPGLVRAAPVLRAAGGPLEPLRARVTRQSYDAMRKGIWQAFDGQIVGDDAVMRWIRNNPAAREAANQVIRGDLAAKKVLRFEDVQDILRVMGRRGRQLQKGGIMTQADATMQSRRHLEGLLDNSVPGFKEANAVWADAVERFKGAKKLIDSIDRALPRFSPELPSRADGVLSTVRETLSNTRTRREMIARMVGDAILDEGEEGLKKMEELVKRGMIAKLFRGTARGTPGGATLGVPGLLSGRED